MELNLYLVKHGVELTIFLRSVKKNNLPINTKGVNIPSSFGLCTLERQT